MKAETEGDVKSLPDERRQFVRIHHSVQLSCRIVGVPEHDDRIPVRNLGTGGVLLVTRKPLAPGALLDMRVTLTEGVEFRLHGRVVWSEFNPGIGNNENGVCFVGLDQEQRKNVLALLGHSDGIERRKHIRLARQLLVEYRRAGGLLRRWRGAFTQDISMGGAAMRTDRRLETGTELRLRIHLDDQNPKPWQAGAMVIESQPGKELVGSMMTSLRFMPLEPEMSQRLATYISSKLTAKIPGLGAEQL